MQEDADIKFQPWVKMERIKTEFISPTVSFIVTFVKHITYVTLLHVAYCDTPDAVTNPTYRIRLQPIVLGLNSDPQGEGGGDVCSTSLLISKELRMSEGCL